MTTNQTIEEGIEFSPRFDSTGLIPVIAQDEKSGQVLMFAFMNRQSLDLTIKTGFAHYFSRSRRKIWKKGEESGHIQQVREILVDCDQDCLLLKVSVDAGQCHVGFQSCFYRALAAGSNSQLRLIAQRVYDPGKTYRK